MDRVVEVFRKDEFDAMIEKSHVFHQSLCELESMRDKILGNPGIPAPVIHLANQHLEVITENLRLQVIEMGKLVEHMENNNMVELNKVDAYHTLQKDRVQTAKLLELFLPYVLLTSLIRRGISS